MTYGIPYTVRGWGDEIVTTVAVLDETAPEGYLHVVRGTELAGPVILVPTAALTPVDTTPPEPEPGAWLIGETLCVRFDGDGGDHRWQFWNALVGRCDGPWYAVWLELGGSGITPRRLVPEPAPVDVELPWRGISLRDKPIELTRDDHDYHGVPVLRLTVDGESVVAVGPDTAERLGHGLISAARAAREATP